MLREQQSSGPLHVVSSCQRVCTWFQCLVTDLPGAVSVAITRSLKTHAADAGPTHPRVHRSLRVPTAFPAKTSVEAAIATSGIMDPILDVFHTRLTPRPRGVFGSACVPLDFLLV